MKHEDSDILKKLGKDSGFKVPEHYFADFGKNLMESLPEVTITEEPKPSLWTRYKTYLYMAAMFAGIWCMMHIFNTFNGTATGQGSSQMAAGGHDATELSVGDKGDDGKMTYEDSVKNNLSAPHSTTSTPVLK